jgi:hypothetical protein
MFERIRIYTIPIVAISIFLFLLLIFIESIKDEERLYLIETTKRKYFTEKVFEDSENCVTFVEYRSKRNTRVCGQYSITQSKRNAFSY